jgi:hypothetical protein
MHTLPNFPDSTAREIYARLCRTLPPPVEGTPEARAARDDDAMSAFAAQHPTDVMDARPAADFVELKAPAAPTPSASPPRIPWRPPRRQMLPLCDTGTGPSPR